MEKGIKEILEALEAMKIVGVFGKKVGADGKISIADLPLLVDLATKSSDVVAGLSGTGEIVEEFKNLSADEAQQVLAKVYEVISAIKAA